jgi:hypothetical protein
LFSFISWCYCVQNVSCLESSPISLSPAPVHTPTVQPSAIAPSSRPATSSSTLRSSGLRGLCASCGIIVPTSDVHRVENGYNILNILKGSLDSCGRHGNTWDICSTCYSSLIYFRIPSENRINVTLCQDYPSVLDDLTHALTHAEECLMPPCWSYPEATTRWPRISCKPSRAQMTFHCYSPGS